MWEAEWGGKVLFNHGTTHSKGVMILLNPKLDCKIKKITQDKNRRFIIAKLITEDTHLRPCYTKQFFLQLATPR